MSTQVYICHNVAEKKSFEVSSWDVVPEMYYLNTYLIKIHYIPNQLNCVQELIKKIHDDNLWQLTGLYVVDFDRTSSDNESSSEYTQSEDDSSRLSFNDTSSIEEDDFSPLASSTINSDCIGIIANPICNQSEDRNDCSQLTFNDTSCIDEDDFTPLASSTINFDCSDNINNPLYNDCSDIICNPICNQSKDSNDSSFIEEDFTPITSSTINSIANPIFGKIETDGNNKFTFYSLIKYLILN